MTLLAKFSWYQCTIMMFLTGSEVFVQCHRPKNTMAAFVLRFDDTLVIVCRTTSATLSAKRVSFGRESMAHSVGSADTPLVKDSPLTLAVALTL